MGFKVASSSCKTSGTYNQVEEYFEIIKLQGPGNHLLHRPNLV